MSTPPRVTVVIATFNYAPILRTAISSVLDQSFRNWELRVVGDCCTDESETVVGAFADPRIHWANLPARTGFQSGPNNAAIAEARGELIAYLSHDDLWLPHHLASAVAAIDQGADLVYGLCLRVASPHESFVSPRRKGTRKPKWAASQVVHRRDLAVRVGGWRFPDELSGAPGRDLWTRMRTAGARLRRCDRLSVIKFPARHREGVYRTRPTWEQTEWLARIRQEPDLEVRLLANPSSRFNPSRRSRERRRLLGRACRIAIRERHWSAVPSLAAGVLRLWMERSSGRKPHRPGHGQRKAQSCAPSSALGYADRVAAKRRFNGVRPLQ